MGNRFFLIRLEALLGGLFWISCAWAMEPESVSMHQILAAQGQATRHGDAAAAKAAGKELLARLNQQQPPVEGEQASQPDLRQKAQELAQDQNNLNQQGQGSQKEIQQETQKAAKEAQQQGKAQAAQDLRQAAQAMQRAQTAQEQGQAQSAEQAAREAHNHLQSALKNLPSERQKQQPRPGQSEAAQKLAEMQAAQDQARDQRKQAFGLPATPPRTSVERDW